MQQILIKVKPSSRLELSLDQFSPSLLLFIFLSCRLEVKIANRIFHKSRDAPFAKKSSWGSIDIALARLAEEVDITVYTPVCLPVLGQDYISPNKSGQRFARRRWATAYGKGR